MTITIQRVIDAAREQSIVPNPVGVEHGTRLILAACVEVIEGLLPHMLAAGDAPTIMGDTGIIYVCSVCGDPVESEPCREHQWRAYERIDGIDVEIRSHDA